MLSKLNHHQKAILALIVANIIWGAAAPIFKWSFSNLHPFTLAFLRFGFASLLFLPFVVGRPGIKKEHWRNLILLALFGVTVNISFFFLGLELAPAINAPMIATAGPVFLLFGSFFWLKERPKRKIVLGTLIGLIGVSFIIIQPIIEKGFDISVIGNLFFVIATLSGVLHAVFAKKISPFYPAYVFTFWTFFLGTLTFTPMFFYETSRYGFLPNLDLTGIIGILFGAYLCSGLAYYLYHYAIKNIYAQEVGVFSYITPIVAVFIAMPLLGEIPDQIYLTGAILVFLGIFIAEGRLPHHWFLHKWQEKNQS